MKADYWFKDKLSNFAEEADEESKLFIAFSEPIDGQGKIWFVDSGCSNNMIGRRQSLSNLM